MSYSFTVQGATKEEAVAKVQAELAKVDAQQPRDLPSTRRAIALTTDMLAELPEDDTKDVGVSVHGSVGWHQPQGGAEQYTGIGVGVSVHFVTRPKA